MKPTELTSLFSAKEQTLLVATEPLRLAAHTEDELGEILLLVRRARNKYSGLHRRQASATVPAVGRRAATQSTNLRTLRKAEIFEDALAPRLEGVQRRRPGRGQLAEVRAPRPRGDGEVIARSGSRACTAQHSPHRPHQRVDRCEAWGGAGGEGRPVTPRLVEGARCASPGDPRRPLTLAPRENGGRVVGPAIACPHERRA